jgi:amino-acid N-acetyltransferase
VSDINQHYVNWFRQSSPYVRQHRGKTIVVMLPGEFISEPYISSIVNDLAVLTGLGMKLVIVHGARGQIEEQLKTQNLETQYHQGIRVTPHDQIIEILKAVGALRSQLEAHFSSGLPNSPMYGSKVRVRSGNFISAKPKGIHDGIDFQFTGEVRRVDKTGIESLLEQENIVLISPIGYSLTGEVFNLAFADVAVQVAAQIGADKLIAYNDDGQIKDAEGSGFREMTLLKCKRFLVEKNQHRESNTYFSLQACHSACDLGVPRAHIVSAKDDGSILKELYTRDGAGTMVYRDHYETIRTATIDDVPGILELIGPLEDQGVLVKRSRERLETEISCFTVMLKDGLIVGSAALYPIADTQFGELACVAIHEEYQKNGRAQKLLTHIEREAAKLKLQKLFALTTQTSHWFMEQGFIECTIDALPNERQSLYNFQRKSKVFRKDVEPIGPDHSSLKGD